MKTSARMIAYTTKYRSPSIWKPLLLGDSREENWAYFPEPSMILKKELDGTAQEQQMFALLSQLFQYDFHNKNQYFINLEIRPLLQELKMFMKTSAMTEKNAFEKIHETLLEILQGGFSTKSEYWQNRIATFKHETKVLMEKLLEKSSTDILSDKMIQNMQNQIQKANSNLETRIQINHGQKMTAYEHGLRGPFSLSASILTTNRWQRDRHLFFNIYQSMKKEEKETFLQALSMTEPTLLSVQKMTKEQWEVFLTNVMPMVASYVKTQEEDRKNQVILQEEEILRRVSKSTENQWQQMKQILTQNERLDFQNLRSFFQVEERHRLSSKDWIQEKREFIDYVQKNQYIGQLNPLWNTVENSKETEHAQPPYMERMPQPLTVHQEISEKLTEWLFNLRQNHLQEVKNVYAESGNVSYAKSLLETMQNRMPAEISSLISLEKQTTSRYVENFRKSDAEPIGLITQNQTISGNQHMLRVSQNLSMLTANHWQRDRRNFLHIYGAMQKKEKDTFLQALSLTETELLSVQKMTEKQWEVFLNNTLPLISSYVKKEKEDQKTREIVREKEILRPLSELTEKQWQEIKRILVQNEHSEFQNLRTFFQMESQAHHLTSQNWEQEKQTFIDYVEQNQYVSLLNSLLLTVHGTNETNHMLVPQTEKILYTEPVEQETAEKLAEWISDLRVERLQEKRDADENSENFYGRSSLEAARIEHKMDSLESAPSQRENGFGRKYGKPGIEPMGLLTRKQTILQNQQIGHLAQNISVLTAERWQRDRDHFYSMYKAMQKDEKETFLQELSMTEKELHSVGKMTKEQWEVFVTNTLPLISSYVNKQEVERRTHEMVHEKEILRRVTEFTESQWQEIKKIFMHHERSDIQNLRSFFNVESQEHPSSSWNWIQEKQAFIKYVQKNGYVPLLDTVLTVVDKTAANSHLFENQSHKIAHSASEQQDVTEKLTEWLSYLTENQWQEIKDVFTENSHKAYLKPLLETMQQQRPGREEPIFSAEKQGIIRYLTDHTDVSINVINLLSEKEDIRNSLENWMIFPTEIEKTGPFMPVVAENQLSDDLDSQASAVTESLTEWLSYLTESQWQEVKSVLENHHDEAYIFPLMEMVKSQKPYEMEPLFSAEKRGAMTYINQNKQIGTALIKIFMDQENIKKNLSQWVDQTLWKTVEENIKKASSKEFLVSRAESQQQKDTVVTLTEWISRLTEPQMEEIRRTIVNEKQYQNFQHLLAFSEHSGEGPSLPMQKRALINHVTENHTFASEFLEFIQQNKKLNLIFQKLQQKIQTQGKTENIFYEENRIPQNLALSAENQERNIHRDAAIQMIKWVQHMKSEQNRIGAQGNDLETHMTAIHKQKFDLYSPVAFMGNQKERDSDGFQQKKSIHQNFAVYGNLGRKIYQSFHDIHQGQSDNARIEPDFYGPVQLVVAKQSQGGGIVQTPPKMPDVVTEAKKVMQTEVHDIITRKSGQEAESADSKTVLDLIKRLDIQQKEIEKIRSSQKQMLNITDISIVTEKIMNQMQSQLRLEKMRRGL